MSMDLPDTITGLLGTNVRPTAVIPAPPPPKLSRAKTFKKSVSSKLIKVGSSKGCLFGPPMKEGKKYKFLIFPAHANKLW